MDTCNYVRCERSGAVQVYDDRGNLSEVLCRPHAVELARAHAARFVVFDAATGAPFLHLAVEVLLDE